MMPLQVDVILLFNITDYAAQPWLDRGCTVLAVDTQHNTYGYNLVWRGNNANYIVSDMEINEENVKWLKGFNPKLVIAFPPCTDLAVSGAAHFAKKKEENPMFQQEAADLAKLASTFDCPYMIENPVSVLSTLWRSPDYRFHPWEYGGYLPVDDVHPDYPKYIAPRDAYPKKTCIWIGNGFVIPEKKTVPVSPGYSKQYKLLGSKSLKTKNIRSATPRGFMEAVAQANEHLVRDTNAQE